MAESSSSSSEVNVAVGDEVGLWQRKTHTVMYGRVAAFIDATQKFVVEYHNGSSVNVSKKWLLERISEAKNNGNSNGNGNANSKSSIAPSNLSQEFMAAKKAATFAKLEQRHAQRKEQADARKAADAAKADPSENPKVFWADFNAKLEQAGQMIDDCVATHTKKLRRVAAKKQIAAISGA